MFVVHTIILVHAPRTHNKKYGTLLSLTLTSSIQPRHRSTEKLLRRRPPNIPTQKIRNKRKEEEEKMLVLLQSLTIANT